MNFEIEKNRSDSVSGAEVCKSKQCNCKMESANPKVLLQCVTSLPKTKSVCALPEKTRFKCPAFGNDCFLILFFLKCCQLNIWRYHTLPRGDWL